VAHAQQADFLPPDEAFQFTAKVQDAKTVLLQFKAHDGYYLYQERFHFESQTPGVELGKPEFPPAHKIFDKNLGHEVFHYRGLVPIPLAVLKAPATFKMLVTYQGCADAGLCYPPIEKLATISLSGFGGNGTVSISEPDDDSGSAPAASGSEASGLVQGLMAGASAAQPAAASASAAAAPAGCNGIGRHRSGCCGRCRPGWRLVAHWSGAGIGQPAQHHSHVPGVRSAAGLHALRAADDSHSVEHHRGSG
jgi:Thiol:disulfide interchange protein